MFAPNPETADPVLYRYRYVFVVTYARSGSTLLQSVLNATTGTQIRGENRNILYHLFKAVAAANRGHRVRSKAARPRLPDHPWFGFDELRGEAFEAALLNAFVRDVLTPDPAAQVTGFKEIRYTAQSMQMDDFAPFMDFLLSRFPQARIIFNSRRSEDVIVSSMMAMEQPHLTRRVLKEADERFAAYDRVSDRTLHMQYEDYTGDHGLIHRMLDFLQLDWTEAAVAAVMGKRLNHPSRPGGVDD